MTAPTLAELATEFPIDAIVPIVEALLAASTDYHHDDAPEELLAELEMARDLDGLPEDLTDRVCAALARIGQLN